MPIPVQHEDEETVSAFPHTVEQCVLCGDLTRFWHMTTNTPVCESCAAITSERQLSQRLNPRRDPKRKSLTVTVGGQKRFVRKIHKYTENEFEGEYKGHLILCLPSEDTVEAFCITVTSLRGHNEGMMAYNGYSPRDVTTIEQAVIEAIGGSRL